MRNIHIVLKYAFIVFVFCRCNQPATNNDKNGDPVDSINVSDSNKSVPARKVEIKNIAYHFEKSKAWIKKNGADSQNIVMAINRTDRNRIGQLDSILVPDDVTGSRESYFPFPLNVPFLKDITKIIYFSYPAQSFGAYEKGVLMYTGPVNMGRKKDPTPTGLYYTNWKAEKTTSTFNDEWDLRWNVNIENKLGIGWHQYDLPGYPSSHSCLRLQETDARALYKWADQWIEGEKGVVKAQGNPVIVFGTYPFGAPKPWLQLKADPHSLDITPALIQQQTESFLPGILYQQKRREAVISSDTKEGK